MMIRSSALVLSLLLVSGLVGPSFVAADESCRLTVKFDGEEKPAIAALQLVSADPKARPLTMDETDPGIYSRQAVPPGTWKIQATPIKGTAGSASWPVDTHQPIQLQQPGNYVIQAKLGPDPKRTGLRRLYLTLQDAPLGAEVFETPLNYKAQGKPITIYLFLAQDAADPERVPTRVDLAQIGFPDEATRKQMPTWLSDKFGKVAIDGLPNGQHILIAQADAKNATILPVTVPSARGTNHRQLNPLPKWAWDKQAPHPEIEAKVEGKGEDERLLITITNHTDKPYLVSERDLQVSSQQWEMLVFPNGMADGQLPGDAVHTIAALGAPRKNQSEIPVGKSETFSLNWSDLVRRGLWVLRHDANPEKVGVKKAVRQEFRVSSGQSLLLTNPEIILKRTVELDVTIRDAMNKPLRPHRLWLRYSGKSDHANWVTLLQPSLSKPGVYQRVLLPAARDWQIFMETMEGGSDEPWNSSGVISLEKPGHYILDLQPLPAMNGSDPRELKVLVKQAPEGANVIATQVPQVAKPNPEPTAVPLPDKTPFDNAVTAREMYLRGYREGYLWATDPNRQNYCITNPSDHNLPAIRGIIEGWRDGVPKATGIPGDLPAKYARFIIVNIPAPEAKTK